MIEKDGYRMTTKDIMLLAKNKECIAKLNELAMLSEENENGKNKEKIEVLAIQIHNAIVIEKMNLHRF